MTTKNFLISGIAGGIANFLLGWLFYGIIFKETFPQPDENDNALVYIFLGCLVFGLFIAYIYTKWAQISTLVTGTKAGAIIGLFMGLFWNFFNLAMNTNATLELAGLDVVITIIMTAITGAIIGVVIGKID